ncbi:MAG: excinuclease ABC subunit UvrC [Planctomycetota bacterium]
MDSRIAAKVARFPMGPGVYQFLAADGSTLYAGKAANLRARVRNYLRPGGDGRWLLRFLEREAVDVEFVSTATEQEALLLENTVIKKHKPPYNLKLKDDKSFLMLRLDLEEPWPWYRLVRRRRDDGALYFGPWPSAKVVRRTLRLLHKITPLRDCTDHVFDNRSRPCIKHQIGRCPAPCTGLVDRAAYDELLQRSMRLLRGDASAVVRDLRAQMVTAAESLQFERAQVLKHQIEALQAISEPKTVVGQDTDEDAIGLHRTGDEVTCAFLSFRAGSLESCRRFSFRTELPDDLLLSDLLPRLYEGDRHVPSSVLVPSIPIEAQLIEEWLGQKRGAAVSFHVPQRGPRRRQLELAEQNAALADAVDADATARRAAAGERLARRLELDAPPQRLHCIDVSTTQGQETVASRVCFVDGEPDKSQYRRFKIRTEHAGDDFSAMQEAVTRSLRLCLERDDEELPDLLVVDGGHGQLASAQRAIAELALDGQLHVCGLAKSRLRGVGDKKTATGERLVVPGKELPIPLQENAPETLLVAALRDEAHRFAITFHRQRRTKIGSELDEVKGIGPERRRLLLRHFGSLSALRQATRAQIRAVPGLPAAIADEVFAALQAGPKGA